jgi:dTDP-4-dehydrorhamnose reductase
MIRVLVLGHKGMLGRAVVRFFSTVPEFVVLTIDSRWGAKEFGVDIKNINPDFIINCIGKIPQKNNAGVENYSDINIALPRYLDTLGIKIIHPSTDCEFKGDIPEGSVYSKNSPRDAEDLYGTSKAKISEELENKSENTKIIRTSIIGHEENSHVALLDWFLSQAETVKGYTNHYWNGITTLEWAKQCKTIISNWDSFPIINQYGTEEHNSKFDLLTIFKRVYNKNIDIVPFQTEITVNKCLKSDLKINDLETQLKELKQFFNN